MKNKLRRTLCCLLSMALLLALMAMPASGAAGFDDVPNGAWYTDAVKDLVSRGIMNGRGNGRFEPRGSISRAEFATMLARTALSEDELAQYKYRGDFSDVSQGHWANRYINWAKENGVVNGYNGKFNPGGKITRQDMAVMIMNYSKAMCVGLPPVTDSASFRDSGKITGYARESVAACARAGVLNGSGGYVRPTDTSMRSEAAQLFSNFLRLGRSPQFTVIRKRAGGINVRGVTFDPMDYTPSVVLGEGRIRGGESMGSIIQRTGAQIAVNGGFFDLSSYTSYGTLINHREILTTFNDYSPKKSAIVMDGSGRWLVENFYTDVILTAVKYDETEKTARHVAVNRHPDLPTDSTRIIFTREWGQRLGFSPKYAVKVDADGFAEKIYHNTDVDIPEEGYLLVQRGDNPWDNSFITSICEGSFIDRQVEYTGASTQDISCCIGAGPRIVKDGRAYGSADTYREEGLNNIDNFSDAVRVCIGVKPDGDLVIISAYASIPEVAGAMAALGCESAINLDGGGSANLYAGGTYFTGPRDRPLNNALVFS